MALINIIIHIYRNNIYFFAQHQGFEGSIVAENFSSSDPSSNNPMMHGGLDNGGGLISFHRVSENVCFLFFLNSRCPRHQIFRPKLSPEKGLVHDLYTYWILKIPRLQYFILLLCTNLLPWTICALWKKPKPIKDQSVLTVSFSSPVFKFRYIQ